MVDPTNPEGVNGPDSQPGGDTSIPEPVAPPVAAPDAGALKENRIPHSRVQEMIQKERERALHEFREREYAPLQKQYKDMNDRMVQAELARLEKMGWYKPEAPKPITQEDLDKALKARMDEMRQEQMHLYHAQRIQEGFREASRKHPALATRNFFKQSVLARYAENPSADFTSLADEVAKEFEALYAEREAAASKKRDEEREPHRRVVPSGRGAAGGGSKESGKKSVAERIQAGLKASREG